MPPGLPDAAFGALEQGRVVIGGPVYPSFVAFRPIRVEDLL
jgi:hypothetical protein